MVFIDQEWSREFFGKKIYSFSKYTCNTDIFVDINFFVLGYQMYKYVYDIMLKIM